MEEYKLTGEDVRQARERIKTHVLMTPLLRAEALERAGRRVFIKPENLQRTGSFKARGAFNAVASLTPEQKARGVITFSSGNHGTAVAFAAHELGKQERGQPYHCTVVMPEGASVLKANRIRALGATIVHCGATNTEREVKAREIAAEKGYEVIPAYDDPRVIAGQGTLGTEIMDQWMAIPSRTRRLYMVAGPVGGGGLMSGTSAALRTRGFGGRVVGVEPADANDTQQSFAKGERVETPVSSTICDGLRCTIPGKLTFPIMQKSMEGIVTVEEADVVRAMAWMLNELKLLVEPSGAVAIAAWMTGALYNAEHNPESPEHAGDVVLIVSGGNIEPKLLLSALK
jgi:threonine dehydratase